MEKADPMAHTIYTICPDTVIQVGKPDDDDPAKPCCVDGDMTVFVKSQSTIQCGHDGSSANHCVLTGGYTHVFAAGKKPYSDQEIAENVHFVGLTFDAADFLGVGLAEKGDVTFTDCIFQVGGATFFWRFVITFRLSRTHYICVPPPPVVVVFVRTLSTRLALFCRPIHRTRPRTQ